jgi:hypothetical protein
VSSGPGQQAELLELRWTQLAVLPVQKTESETLISVSSPPLLPPPCSLQASLSLLAGRYQKLFWAAGLGVEPWELMK